MPVRKEATWGDAVRGILGALATVVILGLLYDPTVSRFWPDMLACATVTLICVATATRKVAVAATIIAIIFSRVLVAVIAWCISALHR